MPHPKSRSLLSHMILLSTVGRLTENECDGSAFPTAQRHEGMRQPHHERGIVEAVVAVVRVAVNWRGARVPHVPDRQDVHLPVVNRRKGHGRDGTSRQQLGMTEVRVMLDGGMSFNLVKAEQLPEPVGNVYGRAAHGMARATAA